MGQERATEHPCYFEQVPTFTKSHFHTLQNWVTKVYIDLVELWCDTNGSAFVDKSSTMPGTQRLPK